MARLYLTGGLHLEGPTGAFDDGDLPGNQGRITFAVLAVERRPISDDALADIIWDQSPPEQWKSALSPVVSKIRSLLTKTGLDGASALTSLGGAYEVPPTLRHLGRPRGRLPPPRPRRGRPASR